MINWQAALGTVNAVVPCLSTDPEPSSGVPVFAIRVHTDTGTSRMYMGATYGWIDNPFLITSGSSGSFDSGTAVNALDDAGQAGMEGWLDSIRTHADRPNVTITGPLVARRSVIYGPDGSVASVVTGGLVTNGQPLSSDIDGITAKVDTASGAGAVTGATTSEAAVTTDATGTNHQYLRGLVTIMGAVTASPVANSIGDRLKAIGAYLATLAGAVSGGIFQVAETATAIQLSNITSTAFENSKQVKAAAGWFFGFSVRNKSLTTALYVGVYNAASKTGTPIQRFRVDPDDETVIPWSGDMGRYFSTGIFLQGLTTGDGTDTNDSSSSLWFDAQYQ